MVYPQLHNGGLSDHSSTSADSYSIPMHALLCRVVAPRSLVISNGVGDVAKYLSEAASSIFKTSDSSVPWEGSGSPFSGESDADSHPFLALETPPASP